MISWLEQQILARKDKKQKPYDALPEHDADSNEEEHYDEKKRPSSSIETSSIEGLVERRPASISARIACSIISLLCAVIVVLGVLLAIQIAKTPRGLLQTAPVPDCEFSSSTIQALLLTSPVPFHETIFNESRDWESSERAHDLWESVIPTSGLVLVENPRKYGLGLGVATSDPNAEVYSVVLTHQFHCLVRCPNAF